MKRRSPLSAAPYPLCVGAAFCLAVVVASLASAADPLSREDVKERLPRPADLGTGWEWVNEDRPISDLGFQITAYYHFRDPDGRQNDSPVVDVRVADSPTAAEAQCAAAERRRRAGDQVVVDREPSLGPTGFQSHYGPHLEYGRRVTFCVANVFVTIGPSRRGLEVARAIRGALER